MEEVSYRLLGIDALTHTVFFADGPSGNITAELSYPPEAMPIALTLSADNGKAYLPAESSGKGTLFVINISQPALYRLPLELPVPRQFSLQPGGQAAYLAAADATLYFIDLVSLTITACGQSGDKNTLCAGLQADEKRLYSIWEHAGSGTFAAFDQQGRLLYEKALPGIPTSLTLDGHGHFIIPYTSTAGSEEGVILMSQNQDDGSLSACVNIPYGNNCCTPSYPAQAALSPDGRTAYIVNEESSSITLLDIQQATIRTCIPIGRSISCLHILSDGKFAIASSHMFADLSLIDLVNGRLLSITDTQKEILGYIALLPESSLPPKE
ncbi:hypothetical protein P22_3721 [Propionispora sp. 2/2-37]|uniref:hypothetical protein n=1 Tax=Propionispora sp. 2/2-37 TaxID=1677858 RepID=UPI0006BB8BD2|nr:hypothetical protein [Propionispora sp. 2/2-37]CUH97590.1 hypothetical protein P22_3721 [Propionispora sp. 2/2-37]